MQRSYTLLSIFLGIGFLTLFVVQATTHVFHAVPAASPEALAPGAMTQEHQARSTTPLPTITTVITGGSGGVNKVPDPECLSGITSTPADVLKLLAPGWTLQDLGEKYRNVTKQTLCYDGWKSEWSKPGGTWVKIADFLSIMHWPSGLFNPSAGTQILIVQGPPDTFKPAQTVIQNNPNTCHWKPNLGIATPDINMCDLASIILKATLLTPLKGAVNTVAGNTNSFLWSTPPQDTYANPDLALTWNTSISIVNALLAGVIAWVGIRYMMSQSFGSWLSYADLLEMLPRLVMALIAAYISVRICQIVIDGSNALSSIFSSDLLLGLQTDPSDLFTLFSQILLCILILVLILEEAARFAILFVLIGFAPIWAFCGATRETQFIFKGGLKALFFVTLLQPCQLAIMSLGQHLTTTIGGQVGTPLYYLVSIALMLFVLFMMSWFLRAGGISMPFGWVGVAGAMVGGRIAGGAARLSGRGAGAFGKHWFKGSIFDKNRASGRGSNNTGGGSNTGRGGSSPTPGSNGPQSGGTPKAKQLPPYSPHKNVIRNARSTAQAVQHANLQHAVKNAGSTKQAIRTYHQLIKYPRGTRKP